MLRRYATSCFLHLHLHTLTWSVLRNITFSCTCPHGRCYAATQHHVSCPCTHGRCYAATQHHVSCTCTHGRCSCYAATQHHLSCTCTHGRCYATSCFLPLHTWSVLRRYATSCFVPLHTWSVLHNIMFLALAHMVGATQHHVSCPCTHGRCYATVFVLSLHTWWMLRDCVCLVIAHIMVDATQPCCLVIAHMVDATQLCVSCHCTHGRCYATVFVLSLHTWWMLPNVRKLVTGVCVLLLRPNLCSCAFLL